MSILFPVICKIVWISRYSLIRSPRCELPIILVHRGILFTITIKTKEFLTIRIVSFYYFHYHRAWFPWLFFSNFLVATSVMPSNTVRRSFCFFRACSQGVYASNVMLIAFWRHIWDFQMVYFVIIRISRPKPMIFWINRRIFIGLSVKMVHFTRCELFSNVQRNEPCQFVECLIANYCGRWFHRWLT